MRITTCIIFLLTLLIGHAPVDAQSAPAKESTERKLQDREDKLKSGVMAKGTEDATPWYSIDSRNAGPTIFLTGGVHGDEPAGAYAAEQIRHWNLLKGKLFVIPRVNERALKARTRFIPDAPKASRDLNRNFGGKNKEGLAKRVWHLVKKEKPDWLIDLHEGTDFHIENKKSVGSTIIAAKDDSTIAAASAMISAVNTCIISEKRPFQRLTNPIKGSLARAAFDQLKIKSMICETTIKSQGLPFRARQHRVMVHALLKHLGMIGKSLTPNQMIHRDAKVKSYALYDSSGSAGKGVPFVEQQLGTGENHQVIRVSARDIQSAALMPFDVVIFTGGSGSGQAKSLGESGRKQVAAFVREGGGYVGICAGAYLACSGFSWGLGILDAKTASNKWRRGIGKVKVSASATGRKDLKLKDSFSILYANGPILVPHNQADIPDFEVLCSFKTELAKNGTPKGIMKGSPAMASGTYGKGKVLVSSPHPEQTKGMEGWIISAVEYVAKK